ncbi:MAG: hypothetical protein IPP06_00050 [Saprospiraceae bacterium]|nr:hypothetical protein [Candidatus Vicinibacter affinis]
MVVTGIGSSSDYLRGVYLQSNNKIIISGVSEDDAAIVRLLPTGELDYKFSSDGITTLAICGVDATSDITETINNKILFLGSKCTGSGIYRLLENGILDSTFGISGSIINPLGLNSRIFRLKNDNFGIINGNKVAEYLVNGDLNFNYGIGGFSSADIPDQFFTKYSTMLSDGSFITGGSKQMEK